MPLMATFGIRVERMSGDRVKKSMPPTRNWFSMSVSPPSWLFGNTLTSTLPPVSVRIASAAASMRTLIGCVWGRLFAYFSSNSAAWAREYVRTPGNASAVPRVKGIARRRVRGVIWCSSDQVWPGALAGACKANAVRLVFCHHAQDLQRGFRMGGNARGPEPYLKAVARKWGPGEGWHRRRARLAGSRASSKFGCLSTETGMFQAVSDDFRARCSALPIQLQ